MTQQILILIDEKSSSDMDPLSYWKLKRKVFPNLAKLARKYLGPPATSVASERLFSCSGNICSDKRSRLLPERLELLVYLSKNLKLLNYEY